MPLFVCTVLSLLVCIISIHSRFIHQQCPSSGCSSKSATITSATLDLSNNKRLTTIVPFKFKSQQFYKGIKIFDASLVIYEDEDKVQTPLFGNWYSKKELRQFVPDVTPIITEDDALSLTLNSLSITVDDITQTITNELNIWFDTNTNQAYLAYILEFQYRNASNTNTLYKPLAVVDARGSNKILYLANNPRGRSLSACGTGGNWRRGKYVYCGNEAGTWNVGGTWIKYQSGKSTPKLKHNDFNVYHHYHNNYGSSFKSAFKCARDWSSGTCDVDAYDKTVNGGHGSGIDAYHNAKITWNMYKEWLGEKPIYWPKPFPIYVHVGSNWANAMFTGDAVYIGDGDTKNWHPHVMLDTLAHEIAHGYTYRSSDLVYSGQSGGMDEAYSDMVAVAAWSYNRGGETQWKDWLIGYYERRWGNSAPYSALRYMNDPPLDGWSIDHYCDFYNNIDVHESSGIYNKAVFWLQWKSSIRKWSMEEIFKVWSTANKYWTRTSTMRQGLCGIIQALGDVYPWKWDREKMQDALEDAFDRVGVNCYSSTSC